MPTAGRASEDIVREDIDRGMAGDKATPANGPTKPPTPWPRGRRRNWRAAFMLLGAIVAMSVVLSLWHAFN